MISVSNEVKVYELDGTETAVGLNRPLISIKSHWNNPDRVVLKAGGVPVTVLAADLIAAIQNATNVGRR